MGKRIIPQRRGRGTTTYRSPSHRFKGKISYRPYDDKERNSSVPGKIIDLFHCPGHSAPLVKIKFETGDEILLAAPIGAFTNKEVYSGINAPVENGNILPLKNIPIGTSIYNIEGNPGDGGKYIRSSGSSAKIVGKLENKITIQFPSKKQKTFSELCRATIGIVSGSGRLEKPFGKAGKRFYAMKARNRLYPLTSGVSMNAVDHPFGSGRGKHIGKPKTVGKFAPPGRKVGLIRARRTGIKK